MDFDSLTASMLCLPGFLVGILTMTTTFGCCKTWSLDWRESDRAWRAMRSAQDPSIAATPIFVLKDVLETPNILAYATLLLLFGAGFLFAVIRLSYFHVLDNAIHVIWLRFFWPINNGESFTQYVNNSDILTGILLVLWWLGRG
jgi:hypothetical protein